MLLFKDVDVLGIPSLSLPAGACAIHARRVANDTQSLPKPSHVRAFERNPAANPDGRTETMFAHVRTADKMERKIWQR